MLSKVEGDTCKWTENAVIRTAGILGLKLGMLKLNHSQPFVFFFILSFLQNRTSQSSQSCCALLSSFSHGLYMVASMLEIPKLELLMSLNERLASILPKISQSVRSYWIKAPFFYFLTNLKATILQNVMTKGHNNFGASGSHSFRENMKK